MIICWIIMSNSIYLWRRRFRMRGGRPPNLKELEFSQLCSRLVRKKKQEISNVDIYKNRKLVVLMKVDFIARVYLKVVVWIKESTNHLKLQICLRSCLFIAEKNIILRTTKPIITIISMLTLIIS